MKNVYMWVIVCQVFISFICKESQYQVGQVVFMFLVFLVVGSIFQGGVFWVRGKRRRLDRYSFVQIFLEFWRIYQDGVFFIIVIVSNYKFMIQVVVGKVLLLYLLVFLMVWFFEGVRVFFREFLYFYFWGGFEVFKLQVGSCSFFGCFLKGNVILFFFRERVRGIKKEVWGLNCYQDVR